VFSLILLAPSWGGMINGMMTLSGPGISCAPTPILKFHDRVLVVLRHVDLRRSDMSIKTRQLAVH